MSVIWNTLSITNTWAGCSVSHAPKVPTGVLSQRTVRQGCYPYLYLARIRSRSALSCCMKSVMTPTYIIIDPLLFFSIESVPPWALFWQSLISLWLHQNKNHRWNDCKQCYHLPKRRSENNTNKQNNQLAQNYFWEHYSSAKRFFHVVFVSHLSALLFLEIYSYVWTNR